MPINRKVRVYHLAEELNRTDSEILDELQRMGMFVSSLTTRYNTVEDRFVEKIRRKFGVYASGNKPQSQPGDEDGRKVGSEQSTHSAQPVSRRPNLTEAFRDEEARMRALDAARQHQSDIDKIIAENERLRLDTNKYRLEAEKLRTELERTKAEIERARAASPQQVLCWSPEERRILGESIDLFEKENYVTALVKLAATLERCCNAYLRKKGVPRIDRRSIKLEEIVHHHADELNFDSTDRVRIDMFRVLRNHVVHSHFEPSKTQARWSIKVVTACLAKLG